MTAQPRPVALAINVAAIPRALRDRAQWVGWRYRWIDNRQKWTKSPINVHTGGMASTTDPATWATFDEATIGINQHGLDGVGYVFSSDDPYCGIDLDRCRNDATGTLDAWAQDIIDQIDTYTEVSPSGTGVKLFVQATLPDGARRIGQIECYHEGRFFTVTGHAICGAQPEPRQRIVERWHAQTFPAIPDEPEQRPEHVASSLDDQDIIERARRAANGVKFWALWGGDTGGYTSASEADLALCSMLAFWCGPDPHRIDQLYRQSDLYRKKWERKDYRESTLAHAIKRAEFYDPAKPNAGFTFADPLPDDDIDDDDDLETGSASDKWLVDLEDLLAEPDEDEEWIVNGICAHPTVSLVCGDAKTYKSILVQEMCVAVATGTPFLGLFAVPEPRTVVYVQEESSRRAVRKRFRWLLKGRGMTVADLERRLKIVTNRGVQLDQPKEVQKLVSRAVKKYQPALLAFDPLVEMHSGDENKTEQMRPVMRVIKALRDQFNVSIIVVHHNNKSPEFNTPEKSIRGSTAIWAAMDGGMFVLAGQDDNEKRIKVMLKEGGQVDPFLYKPMFNGDHSTITFDVAELEVGGKRMTDEAIARAVARLGGWVSVEDVSGELGLSTKSLRPRLDRLVVNGGLKHRVGPRNKHHWASTEVKDDDPAF